jgi:predicted secreted protein
MTASERDHRSAGARPGSTRCPSPLADDEMPVTLAGLFGGHAVHDGAGMIKLELPHIVERGALTRVSVAVNWPIVLVNAAPLLAKITLLPDIVPPHLGFEVRLEAATHLRALVQCGDGTVLQVKRWVWVMPPPGSVDPVSAMLSSGRSKEGELPRPPGEAMRVVDRRQAGK